MESVNEVIAEHSAEPGGNVDPATPLHNLVGDDAVMYVDLVQQAGSLEAWIPIGTSIAESVSGPRPPR